MSELIKIYQDKTRRKGGHASWVVDLRSDSIKKSGDTKGQKDITLIPKKKLRKRQSS